MDDSDHEIKDNEIAHALYSVQNIGTVHQPEPGSAAFSSPSPVAHAS